MSHKLLDDLVSLDTGLKYVGFQKRLGATIIDCLILLFIIGMLAMGSGFLLIVFHWMKLDSVMIISGGLFGALMIILLYFSLWECSQSQGTWGKQVIGIKVINSKGKRLSFGRAVLRFLLKVMSLLCFFIGFIIIRHNEKKQGLHDIICKTYIVRNELKIQT